ncbi:MAG: hypothetical protein V3S56_04945, partial [Gemmatimonadota bacterium]
MRQIVLADHAQGIDVRLAVAAENLDDRSARLSLSLWVLVDLHDHLHAFGGVLGSCVRDKDRPVRLLSFGLDEPPSPLLLQPADELTPASLKDSNNPALIDHSAAALAFLENARQDG